MMMALHLILVLFSPTPSPGQPWPISSLAQDPGPHLLGKGAQVPANAVCGVCSHSVIISSSLSARPQTFPD